MSPEQRLELRRLLEQGLPLAPRPYQVLAQRLDCSEDTVLAQVKQWQAQGLFRRVGLVLHHRALGYRANAMLVLDIPDNEVDEIGQRLGQVSGINLCYRRPRRPPQWHYNLFCMIHGHEREQVRQRIARLLSEQGLEHHPHALLFSTHTYKQRGGRYAPAAEHSHG